MGKILTEKSVPLNYIKESGTRDDGKHYLGKLAGVGADFLHPTRNGRRYPYELWVNVENSDDFKEGMETLTIFGEADHPETRIDTSIKEIAIVLTKFEIRKDEGIVYTEFDILDTPNGRILKELLDYGSQIGVSSRGLGDEVVKDGETIIDPDTYVFYGFDAVVMPAVVKARPTVVESANRNLLSSISNEIENASCESELSSIKRIVESVNLPELDSIKESIDIKLSSYNNGDNISEKLQEDLEDLAIENESLKSENSKLMSKISANNIRIEKLTRLIKDIKANSRSLSKMLQNSKLEIANLQDEAINSAEQMTQISSTLESMKIKYSRKVESLNKRYDSSNNQYKAKISKLSKELESLNSKYKDSINELNSVKSEKMKLESRLGCMKSAKILSESSMRSVKSDMSKKLTEASSKIRCITDKYIDTKCAQEGLNVKTVKDMIPENCSIEDLDKLISELSDRKRRLDMLPIVVQPVTARLQESVGEVSDEDIQTMNILKGNLK